jgi:hypothetical protein
VGTDVHMLVEISNDGEPWRPIKFTPMPVMGKRDYVLFSLLADSRNHAGRHDPIWQEPRTVRDSTGEAHDVPGWWYRVDDGGHDRIEPIAPPRGVPDDACLIWRAFVAMWEARGAVLDVTWLTPEDITGADWDQPVYSYGVLREEEYLLLRDNGEMPEANAQQAGGPGVRTVNEVEYAAGMRGEKTTCVSARWRSGTVREVSGSFLEVAEEIIGVMPPTSRLRFMLLFES